MELYKYLPERIAVYLEKYQYRDEITEIRIRRNSPVQFTLYGNTVNADIPSVSKQETDDIFYKMCNGSINIYDDEISQGYITAGSKWRVGIGGEYSYSREKGRYTLRELHSLNIRISKNNLTFINQDRLFDGKVSSVLIIGPPHSGKTSLLRLYAKQLSEKYRVAICDERREIYTQELECDVLQGIKKSVAISMATRTLNPQYIICDEIGSREEAEEILSEVNTGVKFICTAHGETSDQVLKRPNIKLLADNGVFSRYVSVCQSDKKFYIKEIKDA